MYAFSHRGGKSKKELTALSRLRQMLNEDRFLRGSLLQMERNCGKKTCRCMSNKTYRHRSWYVGRSLKGKQIMKYVPDAQAVKIKGWIKRYREAKKLLMLLGDISWEQIGKGIE